MLQLHTRLVHKRLILQVLLPLMQCIASAKHGVKVWAPVPSRRHDVRVGWPVALEVPRIEALQRVHLSIPSRQLLGNILGAVNME